jgi:hemerythrin
MIEESFQHYKMDLPEVDKSHWALFQMLNRMTYTLPQPEMLELASKLNQMWVEHDHEEEKLMEKMGYPYIDAHKETHRLMTEQFQQFKQKFKSDHKYTNDFFKSDLENLIRDHIDHVDSQYAAWAKKIHFLS